MTDRIAPTRTAVFEKRLKQRYASERRFKALGLGAILFSVLVLGLTIGPLVKKWTGGVGPATL